MRSRFRSIAFLLTLMLTLALAGPLPAIAAIRTVSDCGDSGSSTLRGQIAAAASGDTILVPACMIRLFSALSIFTNVTILGSGAKTTILDGQGVTQVLNTSGTVVLSGVTIQNGRGSSGGGIF